MPQVSLDRGVYIPRSNTAVKTLELNDYSKGMNSFIGNDKLPVDNGGVNLWRLAQDARITTLGEYDTRKGFDFHSAAVGETEDQTQTSTTGAADQSFNNVTRLAQRFTAGTSGRLSKVEVRLKNDASATGVVMVELWSDSSGPSARLARSSIAASTLTSSYAYITARFASAPSVTATTNYWLVVYVQATGTGSYKWSSTTSATTARTSSDSGSTWSAASFALNFKQHYATTGALKGLFRAYKSDGTSVTLKAHGTTLSKVDDVTGALTTVKSGLSANATHYRFVVVNDIVYYCNGYDGLRKWDFTTESQVNSTNYSNLIVHKGLLFGVRTDDPNRIDFSNFADYETFTSTDFIYSPSPKAGSGVVALASLNGYLLIRRMGGCQILSGEDNATFRLDDAPDQKGTYTQETTATDKNYQYFASDDGVYKSNGTTPILMSEGIYNDYLSIANKDDIVLCVNKGRLYMWYPSEGSSFNDKCYVWNLNYGGERDVVESHDTEAYVSRALTAHKDDNGLIVGSSLIGQAYWQELDSNDYSSLGGDINFLLETHYFTFDVPATTKQIRHWKPRFGAQSGNYTVSCEYAYDMRTSWQTYSNVNVQGSGPIWGQVTWGSFTWGTTAEVQADLYVPGEYRRIALRYRHYAARQPQSFLGHTLVAHVRRLR